MRVSRLILWATALFLSLAAGGTAAAQAAGLPPAEAGARNRLNTSPRHGEWVTIDAGSGDKVDAWVVYPERSDRAPVVVVVHEIFGLSDWVRATADQLAAEGFIAIAPDLISGKAPGGKGSSAVSPDDARALIARLTPEEIVRRLDAAATYATSLPAALPRFAVIGFCWGGGVSFAYAAAQPNLGASVVFYGTPPSEPAMQRIKAPVLAFYGGSDARVTSTAVPTADQMKKLGKSFDYAVYDGAGHAFARAQDGMSGANLKAIQQAWPRAMAFLKKSLQDGTSLWRSPQSRYSVTFSDGAPNGRVPVISTGALDAAAIGIEPYCTCADGADLPGGFGDDGTDVAVR